MRSILVASISFTALAIASPGANALELTAAGIAKRFFAQRIPLWVFGPGSVGPLGMAVNSDNNVIVI